MFYGWWLVGLGSLVMCLAAVPLFHGLPIWFPVLENRFGWTRTQLSLAFSLSRVEGGVMGPIEGYLIQRVGPRRMMFIGMIILGAGFILFSRVQELWQFYAAFIMMSMGAGLGTFLPMMTVLNSWFMRRRATAMALVMNGMRGGTILLLPALAYSVNPDRFGDDAWRAVSLGIGILIISLAFPIANRVRNRPEDYGLRPDGDPAPREDLALDRAPGIARPGEEQDYTLGQAVRTSDFWLIALGHGCCSAVIVTVMVHLGTFLRDLDFSLETVGWVLSTYMAIGMGFTLLGGYLGDKFPMRKAIFVFSMFHAAAPLVLLEATAGSTRMVFLFALLMGIGEGRNALTAAIRGNYFGRRAFASIMGISQVPMNILLFGAPLFAGYMFDTTGSYTIPFVTVAFIAFLGGGMFLMLGDPRLPTRAAPSPAPSPAPSAD